MTDVQIFMTIESPDFGRRGMAGAFKNAIDEGMRDWHKRAVPRHFRKSAVARYGGEYRKHRPRTAKQDYFRRKIAKMTPSERAQFYAERRSRTTRQRSQYGESGLRNLDPLNKVPLVRSGKLRLGMTYGNPRHTGPAKARALTISGLPGYTHRNRSNTIHKANAIRTVTISENRDFNRVADRSISRYLRTNTKRQRT